MIERILSAIAPTWALRRAQARRVLSYYEAARPNVQRKQRRDANSGSTAVSLAAKSIREQARHLEQNHDLSRAVLRTLVNNTVGAHGITVEPTPLNRDGEVNEPLAQQMLEIWERWGEQPDVTRQYTWAEAQRISARTKYRDGECFVRLVRGRVRHATEIPLSIELLEPDFFPLTFDRITTGTSANLHDAIEYDNWGRPIAYFAYRGHPGDWDTLDVPSLANLKRLDAQDVLHLAIRDRLHQRRGMSLFAATMGRFDDLKDYEQSESVAAKVAASMGAAIKKGTPDLYPDAGSLDDDSELRDLKFRPGMIFDDLLPGESIEMIGNNGRPNAALVDFRNSLLKAATSGMGASYSSVSREYDGSYSARRQELVDAWIDYSVLSQQLAAEMVRPIYRQVMQAAVGAGLLTLPRGITIDRAWQAMYVTPQMPWIDPLKEQSAWEGLERAGHASGPEIIRRRGRSPSDVLREETAWRQRWRDAGETLMTDPATDHPDAARDPAADPDLEEAA